MRHLTGLFCVLALFIFSAPAQAQFNGASKPGQITVPYETPNFGLYLLPGTEFVSRGKCKDDLEKHPDRRQICIKVPDDSNYRTWWRDEYAKQLTEMGWTSGMAMDQPPYLNYMSGSWVKGCQSRMMILPIYDGDMRKPVKGSLEPIEKLNATYLIFLETTPLDCQIPGRKVTEMNDLLDPVVDIIAPEKLHHMAEFKIQFAPTSQAIEDDRLAKEETPDKLWLGFMLENLETKKRTSLGDAYKIWGRQGTETVRRKIPLGTYRIYAYEYNKQIRRRDAGWSQPFEIVPVSEGSLWVLAGTEAQVCRKFAATPNYQILDVRQRKCGNRPCDGGPKYYVTTSGHMMSVMQSFGGSGMESVVSIQCGP